MPFTIQVCLNKAMENDSLVFSFHSENLKFEYGSWLKQVPIKTGIYFVITKANEISENLSGINDLVLTRKYGENKGPIITKRYKKEELLKKFNNDTFRVMNGNYRILYIEKAGSKEKPEPSLRVRLTQFLKTLYENEITHMGGCAIHQLVDIEMELVYVTMEQLGLPGKDPEHLEKELLKEYKKGNQNNKYPFANWRL